MEFHLGRAIAGKAPGGHLRHSGTLRGHSGRPGALLSGQGLRQPGQVQPGEVQGRDLQPAKRVIITGAQNQFFGATAVDHEEAGFRSRS